MEKGQEKKHEVQYGKKKDLEKAASKKVGKYAWIIERTK